jgi:hypothetical protein
MHIGVRRCIGRGAWSGSSCARHLTAAAANHPAAASSACMQVTQEQAWRQDKINKAASRAPAAAAACPLARLLRDHLLPGGAGCARGMPTPLCFLCVSCCSREGRAAGRWLRQPDSCEAGALGCHRARPRWPPARHGCFAGGGAGGWVGRHCCCGGYCRCWSRFCHWSWSCRWSCYCSRPLEAGTLGAAP